MLVTAYLSEAKNNACGWQQRPKLCELTCVPANNLLSKR